jgi:hypothetical protein
MSPRGYIKWHILSNEHILRRQNCRLCRHLLGDEAAEAQLIEEERQGFRYIRPLAMKMVNYETQRSIYPSFSYFLSHFIYGT